MLVLGPLPYLLHRTFPTGLVFAVLADPRFPRPAALQRREREYRRSSLIVRCPSPGRRRYPRRVVCILLSTEQLKLCCHPLLTDRRTPNRSGFQFCRNFLQANGPPRLVIRLGRRLVLVQLTLPFPHDTLRLCQNLCLDCPLGNLAYSINESAVHPCRHLNDRYQGAVGLPFFAADVSIAFQDIERSCSELRKDFDCYPHLLHLQWNYWSKLVDDVLRLFFSALEWVYRDSYLLHGLFDPQRRMGCTGPWVNGIADDYCNYLTPLVFN